MRGSSRWARLNDGRRRARSRPVAGRGEAPGPAGAGGPGADRPVHRLDGLPPPSRVQPLGLEAHLSAPIHGDRRRGGPALSRLPRGVPPRVFGGDRGDRGRGREPDRRPPGLADGSVRRRHRGGSRVGLWVAWSGFAGPIQVATQRSTPGWEYESLVGSLQWAFTGSGLRHINDSTRLGVAPGWAKGFLLVAALAGVVAVWRRASRRGPFEIGSPSLAALCILLLSAPLLSHPYVIWLTACAAIARTERRGAVRYLAAAAILVTGLLVVS